MKKLVKKKTEFLINSVYRLFFLSNDPGEIRTHLYGLGDHCSIQMNYRVVVN